MIDTSKAAIWALVEELATLPEGSEHDEQTISDARAMIRALAAERDAALAQSTPTPPNAKAPRA